MSEFRVGDRVAGYQLLELVGEGRRGKVYRALQPRLERVVAVKIIRPELAADEHFREQFRRDMQLAASVEHPNVLPVYEADEADGTLFAAMRWVAGPDLHRLITERGPLGSTQSVRILGRVTAALEAAHGVGLVHRDLKATNILLEGDRVYLADFGLASVDDAPTDSRADVYGLGCALYEMLTGSVPFAPESLAIMPRTTAAQRPVRASTRRQELPPAIDGILAKALAPAPADRYRAPAEFVDAVEGALGPGAASERRRGRRRRRLLAIAAGALLAAAAVAAAIALDHGGGQGDKRPQASAGSGPLGGRSLPSPASLPDCGAPFSGPPRDCRSSAGVNVITDVGKPLRLATMNLTVTGMHVAHELRDSRGAIFKAPTGTRLVVIDATATNITKTPQEFEPENLTVSGRSTSLWLFDLQGQIAPYHGPHGADYSTQYDGVIGALPAPLSKVKLYPRLPYAGQLVFYYPESMLAADHRALLEVHELGHGLAYRKTLGGVRLHL